MTLKQNSSEPFRLNRRKSIWINGKEEASASIYKNRTVYSDATYIIKRKPGLDKAETLFIKTDQGYHEANPITYYSNNYKGEKIEVTIDSQFVDSPYGTYPPEWYIDLERELHGCSS